MVGLDQLLPSFKSLKEIGTHKGLSKIGDAITNLIYSITKSIVMERLEARNVSRTILSNALKNADLRGCAKLRADSHDMADTAEAFIGYMYCHENWTIEQMADILQDQLIGTNFTDEHEEIARASAAFTALLEKIKISITPNFSCEE